LQSQFPKNHKSEKKIPRLYACTAPLRACDKYQGARHTQQKIHGDFSLVIFATGLKSLLKYNIIYSFSIVYGLANLLIGQNLYEVIVWQHQHTVSLCLQES